jgi:hypothetical protein
MSLINFLNLFSFKVQFIQKTNQKKRRKNEKKNEKKKKKKRKKKKRREGEYKRLKLKY